jgi:hypothetical protein
MMKTVLAATAILCGVATVGAAWAADTIRPGYWESENTVGFPIGSTKTDRRCITQKDVAKVMEGPSNHIYRCEYPEHSAGGGQISFAGTCVDKKGFRVGISGHGTYTETTLNMSAVVKIGPLGVEASTVAHRLGDVCPPPAPVN